MQCDIKVVNRIKRISGQVNGILKMIESQRSCEELLVQLKAVKNSIKVAMKMLSVTNLIALIEEKHNIKIKDMEKQINLIIK